MKVVAAAALVTLLFGVSAAQADWYPKKRLPKPIDYPIVRPKVKEGHKQNNKPKHPPGPSAQVIAVPTLANA